MSTLPTTGGGLLLGPSPSVVLAYWLRMVLFRYLDWKSGWETFAPRWCSWRRSAGCEASRSRPWNRRSAPSVTVSLRTSLAVVGSWSALPTLRSIWVWLLWRLLLFLQAVRTHLLRLLHPPLRLSRLHWHRPNQFRGQSRLARLLFTSFEVHGNLQPTKRLRRSPPSPSSLLASGSDMAACFLLADAPASPLAQLHLAALLSALSLSIGNFAQCVNLQALWTHGHTCARTWIQVILQCV